MARPEILNTYQKITGLLTTTDDPDKIKGSLKAIILAFEPFKKQKLVAEILIQFAELLPEAPKAELIVSLRGNLNRLSEANENPSIENALYSALQLLTQIAPLNDTDPIDLCAIPEARKISLSIGYQFNLYHLARWLNAKKAFINPCTGTFFSKHDQIQIQQQCREKGVELKAELTQLIEVPQEAYHLDLVQIETLLSGNTCYYIEAIALLTCYLQLHPRDTKARLLRAYSFEHQPNPDKHRALEDYIDAKFNSEAKEHIARLFGELNIPLSRQAAFIRLISSKKIHADQLMEVESSVQSELLNNPNALCTILRAAQIDLSQFLSLDAGIRQQCYIHSTELNLLLADQSISFEQLANYTPQKLDELFSELDELTNSRPKA